MMSKTKVEDIMLDAEDACIEYCEENRGTFTEQEVWIFTEAYNQGAEDMRAKILTLLEKEK
jgi:hypothetical protein